MPISANNRVKIGAFLISTGIGSIFLSAGFGAFSSLSNLVIFYVGGVTSFACGAFLLPSLPPAYSDNIDRNDLNAPPMYSPPPSYNVSVENISENIPLTRISSATPNEEPPSYEIAISENTNNLENHTSQTR